jgi:hypothetical protein
MIFRTKGKGDWEVIQLKPKDIFSAAKYLYKSLENGSLEDYVFYNITDNKQYRIEVK